MSKIRVTIFATIVLIAVVDAASADPYSSIATNTSFGLLGTPLDAAQTVEELPGNPRFSTLESSFVLGGIGNLGNLAATSQQAATEERPAFLGVYLTTKRPFSLSARVSSDTVTDDAIEDSVLANYDTVTENPTTDSTATYRWISSQTSTSYAFQHASAFSTALAYRQSFGKMNLGGTVALRYERGNRDDPATWAEQNKTVVEKVNYDASAGTPPPDPRLDYTTTSVWSAPSTVTTIGLSIPFFTGSDALGHYVSLSADQLQRNDSLAQSVSSSEPTEVGPPSGVITDSRESTADRSRCFTVGGLYRLTLPGFLGQRPENAFRVGISGHIDVTTVEPETTTGSVSDFAVDMTAAAGSRVVLTSRTTTEGNATRSIPDWYRIGLTGDQLIHVDVGDDHVLRVRPGVELSYSTRPTDASLAAVLRSSTIVESSVEEVSTDSDGDDTVDTVVETSRDYHVNAAPLSAVFDARVRVPVVVSLAVTPAVKLLLGSESELMWRQTRIRDADVVLDREVVDTFDGAGNLVSRSESRTDPTTYDAVISNRSYAEATVTTTQRMALHVTLPSAVSLYIVADWSRLFDFDDLTIQAVVPLP